MQLAKTFAAGRIITAASPAQIPWVKSLGADIVVDCASFRVLRFPSRRNSTLPLAHTPHCAIHFEPIVYVSLLLARPDTSGKEVWDVVSDGSVDVVYNNFNSPGNADQAMRKLKPGGFYISIAGALSNSPKIGVTQRQFLVNATRPRDLVRSILIAGRAAQCDTSGCNAHAKLCGLFVNRAFCAKEILTAMYDGGLLKLKVEETFELEEAGHAVAEMEAGRTTGKIAIVVVE